MNYTSQFTKIATTVTAIMAALSSAMAEDDTFECLATGTGPIVEVPAMDGGRLRYEVQNWEAGTRFDARGVRWRMGIEQGYGVQWEYPIYLVPPVTGSRWVIAPGPSLCIAGGIIVGQNPKTQAYPDRKNAATAITTDARDAVVEGFRIENTENAYNPGQGDGFIFRNNWMSYASDDGVEIDGGYASGLVQDNIFDGCYTFLSIGDGSNASPYTKNADGVVAVERNIIKMHNVPWAENSDFQMNEIIKGWWDHNAPHVALHDNIIYVEPQMNRDGTWGKMPWKYSDQFRRVTSCSNNIIIWDDDPSKMFSDAGSIPNDCISFERQVSWYETATRNWIDCHPDVPHIEGDPEADPSACDEHAYGGGGTITKILPDVTARTWPRGGESATESVPSDELGEFVVYRLDGRRVGTAAALLRARHSLRQGVYVARPNGSAPRRVLVASGTER